MMMFASTGWFLAVVVLSAGRAETAPPAAAAEGKWPLDRAGVVARHDVVYTTPSAEVWEAMPTGGGDLSAMVRWDGSLHLHLTKSDAWGFQAPPSVLPGARVFPRLGSTAGRWCVAAAATKVSQAAEREQRSGTKRAEKKNR